MDGQSCEICKSWADNIYWSHFQVLHFAQILCSGYDQHLELPKTFSNNLKEKLPENVGLRGPCGIVWTVGLTTRDGALYFTHGWQQFVKDHSFKENDLLVFKYIGGESLFDVLIFDGDSFCEKVDSYFVRKCEHAENGVGCLSKRRDTDEHVNEVNTHSNAGVECVAPEKSAHNNGFVVPAAIPFEAPSSERTINAGVESASPEQFMHANGDTVPTSVPSQTTVTRVRNLVSAATHVQAKQRRRSSKVSNTHQGVVETDNLVEEVNTPSNAGVDRAALEKSVGHNTVVPTAPFETPIGERTLNNAVVESTNPQQFIHANAGVDRAAIEKSTPHNTAVPVSLPFETPNGEGTFDAVESAPRQKFIQANGGIVASADPLQTTDKRFKIRKLVSGVKHAQTKERGSTLNISGASRGVVDWMTDSDVDSAGQSVAHIEVYTSNRRPVTEDEINNALHLAQAACTEKSLLIVMQPEQVYTGFYLAIPSRWLIEHLPPRSLDLVLRINKNEWHVKYCYDRASYTGELTLGWRKFALDNNLEEFDVCLFQPTGKVIGTWLIDVKIFRVVNDITPPTIPKPKLPAKRVRKRTIRNIETE